MDLDYPSQKKNDLSHQLNRMDRRFGSIILSNPKIVTPGKTLSKRLKKKVLDIIYKDDYTKLYSLIQRQVICLSDQVSKEGHAWTILHYIAKSNSSQCLQYCLRWLYQKQKDNYQQIVNQKNCEEDTPLNVGCLYKSNNVIKLLLEYGGVDIYAINCKKLTAYQIALNSANEEALQLLMKYELKIKNKKFINHQVLKQPLPQIQNRTFQKFCEYLFECFNFGSTPSQIQCPKQTQTDRKKINSEQTPSQIPNIQICWLEHQKIYQKKLPLFSSVSHPFSIRQSNIIVSNLLIVFQALAEHPQLLKRIIYTAEERYYVKFQGIKQAKLVWVDNIFPYLKQNRQSLFLNLQDQLWPMVLHKALSQFYNGYFQPAKVPVFQLLETLTGNQCYLLPISSKKDSKQSILSHLLKIQSKNCILILQSTPQCPLKAEQGRIECFSLLKILGQKLLINCPFIISHDLMKQERYTRQMKLHQSHYQNPNCSTLWVDIDDFLQYFKHGLYCHTINNSIMRHNVVKICFSTQRRTYIMIKTKQKSESDKLYINFKTKSRFNSLIPTKCTGWNVIGTQKQHVQKISCEILGLIQISQLMVPSQVILMCQFDENFDLQNENFIIMTCKSDQVVTVEALDCTIGDLQFIECCKKYFNQNFRQYNAPIIQAVGDYILAMAVSQQSCYIPLPVSLSEDNIVEGMFNQSQMKLQMFPYENIYFAVLSSVQYEVAKNLKIMSYEKQSGTSQRWTDKGNLQIQSV